MSRGLQGFNPWILQRLTAVLLVVASLALLIVIARTPFHDLDSFRRWIHHPLTVMILTVFGVALLLHAWIGIRDVIMDYIRNLGLRISLLTLTALYLTACLVWLLWILL